MKKLKNENDLTSLESKSIEIKKVESSKSSVYQTDGSIVPVCHSEKEIQDYRVPKRHKVK